MRITKFEHACVRVEHDGQVLVIDPGSFTRREAVSGATAVLITHEHADHYDLEHLRATDAPIYTIGAVARQIGDADPSLAERVTVVAPGQRLDVGLPVQVVGEKHAVIHPELPHFDNSGFLVTAGDRTLFHPGDAFTDPGQPVDVLCLPVSAPWSKLSEVLDYARSTKATHYFAIHEMIYSEIALSMVDARVPAMLDGTGSYARLQPGSDLG
ncbi:MAG: hypothetical protein QOJ92_2228 [Frankiales bacterium]|nr:hypothetical protein [Frankiales bacterium]